ncbi:4-methylaminobutanoate oxidase (formaldehyde-forming) [Ensifer adhaerens]|uniref:4-methylaminobutanoate oxidase (Formaldehyde-forming) n=1 Tax=Ensifer adhaerens TaxID=106592 RepID=A0ACC5SUM3_ENSAD|nr:FAD-dependent oxidoreductase [Ensifer adhaerens]MBP1872508.1 4-methylaminobutanoate oxidase (formaldehyde-forming) [Ensifer adhaerens]
MSSKVPSHARIVIVGGGAIGTSIAYHLAKAGEKDVVVLEKTALTAGSTWHAAGLMGQLRSKVNLTRLMQYSADLCARIGAETGQDVGWKNVGSLRLAASDARWEELKRAHTAAKSYGFDMELVGPDEIRRLFPLVDVKGLRGATWIASDGHVDPYSLTHAYAKGARAGGVRIVEGVTVTGFTIDDRRITTVKTTEGDIGCEVVANAAGLWARQLGELAGIDLPITVVEHEYFVTEKSPLVPDDLPTLRDPDANFYVKPEPGAMVIGGWEKETRAAYGLGKLPMSFGQELFADDLERIAEVIEGASNRIPILNELGVRSVVNGPIPISADGEPVMGLAGDFENFFVACGFTSGIAASGGAGRAMANWILEGDPGMDLWAFDLRRFGNPHGGLAYLRDSAIEAYSKYYAVAWPEEERSACRPLRRSPLYEALTAKGAVNGVKFGWERPNYFLKSGEPKPPLETFERAPYAEVIGREHRAVREGVALVDQSSFSKFEVSGPGALRYLQWLAAANVDRSENAVIYTQLLNKRGGIEADLTIMRRREDRFHVVTGSAFGTRDGGWIRRHMPRDGSVHVQNVTGAYGVINLCGPLSRDVLGKASEDDVGNHAFPYMTCRDIRIGWAPVMAARVTYVGELGWELHVPTEYMAYVYELLKAAGAEFGIADVGYKAISSLRMEKRYLYWGADITPDDTPLEAGLGFAVSMKKGNFQGRDAIVAQKETGIARKLACFRLDEPLPVYGGEAMSVDGRIVGMTTSGDFGHTVGASLVFGYLKGEDMALSEIEVEAFGRRSRATAVERCAYDPSGERIRL